MVETIALPLYLWIFIFCSTGLVVITCFSMCFKFFSIPWLFLKHIFAGYSDLYWQLFIFRAWNTELHVLGTSIERSVITQCLSVWTADLGTLSIMHHEEVFFGYQFGGFSPINLLNLFSMPLDVISTPFDTHRFFLITAQSFWQVLSCWLLISLNVAVPSLLFPFLEVFLLFYNLLVMFSAVILFYSLDFRF